MAIGLLILILLLEFSFIPRNWAFYQRHILRTSKLLLHSKSNDISNSKVIDPLDNIKGNQDPTSTKYRVIGSSNSTSLSSRPMEAKVKAMIELRSNSSLLLQQNQSKILKSLPVKLLIVFQEWLSLVNLRTAFTMTTIYFMLVIPIVPYAVSHFHASVVTYLYIGPILFPMPYLYSFCWFNNLCESKILDRLLTKLLIALRDRAIDSIPELEETYAKYVKTSLEINDEAMENYAYAKVVAGIDVDAMLEEIKYVMRERTNPSLSTPITAVDLASLPNGDLLSTAKYLGDVVIAMDSSNSSAKPNQSKQMLLDLQSKFVDQEERAMTNKTISTIESLFDKTDIALQRLKDIGTGKRKTDA
jgi:hypothetical protein